MHIEGNVTSFEDTSAIVKKIVVEIPQKEVDRELERAYRDLQKRVSVRGFRQGKIPRAMLEKQYGEAVKEDAARVIAGHFLEHYLEEKEIVPVAAPVIEDFAFSDGRGLTFTAKVEIKPVIDLETYRGIEVKARTAAATDEEVDGEVGRLREMQAQLHPITDRVEPKDGDVVYFEITELGEKGEGKLEHLSTQLGSGRLTPVLEGRLKTAKAGEAFEIDLPAGKGAKEGETKRFRAKITELKARVLPELNDDFARDLGSYADLAALREEIRGRILKVKEEQSKSEMEEELVREIIAKNPFPVPESMVARQLEIYIESIQQQLGKQNVNLDAAKSELSPRALFTVQRALILDAIAKREGLAVEEADVEAEFKRIAKETGKNTMWVRAQYEKEDMLENLKYQMRERKVLAYLLGAATMVEKKAEEAK